LFFPFSKPCGLGEAVAKSRPFQNEREKGLGRRREGAEPEVGVEEGRFQMLRGIAADVIEMAKAKAKAAIVSRAVDMTTGRAIKEERAKVVAKVGVET